MSALLDGWPGTTVPDAEEAALLAALNATWPAARLWSCAGFTLRDGAGGGKRVSAATAGPDATPEGIAAVEAEMSSAGQRPLFMIRKGDAALDAALEARGYGIVDPTYIYSAPIDRVASAPRPDTDARTITIWEPLALMEEIWAEGGIGPDRLAVMHRVRGTKTGLLGRLGNDPGAAGFVGLHDGIAMLHALEVLPTRRRGGMGRAATIDGAAWAAKQGATTFALLCTRGNAPANALYARLGMDVVGQYHYRQAPAAEG